MCKSQFNDFLDSCMFNEVALCLGTGSEDGEEEEIYKH